MLAGGVAGFAAWMVNPPMHYDKWENAIVPWYGPGLAGLLPLAVALVTYLIVWIRAYLANLDRVNGLVAFKDNLSNHVAAVNATQKIEITVHGESSNDVSQAVVSAMNAVVAVKTAEEAGKRIVEARDAVVKYNNDLASLRRGQRNWFVAGFLPHVPEDLKPIDAREYLPE